MEQLQELMREKHHKFTDEEDQDMMTRIKTTHDQNCQKLNAEPLLQLIKDIRNFFKFSTTTNLSKGGHRAPVVRVRQIMDSLKTETSSSPSTFEALITTITNISCKISTKCTGGKEDIMVSDLIEMLKSYCWDLKVVLLMAALTISFGGIIYLLGETKSKSLRILNNLIEAMVNVTECVTECVTERVVDLNNIPADEKSPDQSAVQDAVYWTIRSVVACGPPFFYFLGLGLEYSPSKAEDDELSKLLKNLNDSHKQLGRYRQFIDESKILKYYRELLLLFAMAHTNNIKILSVLIEAKEGLNKPLYQVSNPEQPVGVEVLEKKNVLLLILPELDVEQEEVQILINMYKNTEKVCDYQLVCLPVGKTTESSKWEKFRNRLNESNMECYLVHHQHQIKQGVIKYMKEVWHFHNKPILVVLDPQGRVITQNAFPNIRIWGGHDLSITVKTEAQLWSEVTWGLEFLFQTIDDAKNILQWVTNENHERFIFLCGGEDIVWIKDFMTKARGVAIANNIEFDILYIGSRTLKQPVKDFINEIRNENQCNCWPVEVISKFWVRLESIWYSRMQVINKNSSVEEDEIMKEIMTILTYDGSEKGWAMISEGTTIKVKAKGDMIMNCFRDYDCWKESPGLKDFMKIVIDYVENKSKNAAKDHDNRLILPVTIGKTPEHLFCEACHSDMDKFVMFRCSKD